MQNTYINLIVLRHGEALNTSPDQLRALTVRGRQQIKNQCEWLVDSGFKADCLLHSPYLRTTETAQIAADCFSDATIIEEALITPDGHPEVIAELLPNLKFSNILLISHMPLVSYLTSTLVPQNAILGFPVAGLCWLKLEVRSLTPDTNGRTFSIIESSSILQTIKVAE